MISRRVGLCVVVATALGVTSSANAQSESGYRSPPEPIVRALEQPRTPYATASPGGRWLVLQHRGDRPSITELARPVRQLASWTIDPATNRQWYPTMRPVVRLALIDTTTGAETALDVPTGDLGRVLWSPDGEHFAFMRSAFDHTQLWIGAVAERKARVVQGIHLNAARISGAFASYLPCHWSGDGKQLYCLTVPENRGEPPRELGAGPGAQESSGTSDEPASNISFPDDFRLKGPAGEALYDYYMTAQPKVIDVRAGVARSIGSRAVYERFEPSPDGRHILSIRIVRPYSLQMADSRFPRVVEVLDAAGVVEREIARSALDGSGHWGQGWAPVGPRQFFWRPDGGATLAYYEAMDGGDPRAKVAHRDRLMLLPAPFMGAPRELFRSELRMGFYPVRALWGERGLAVVEEYDPETNLRRAWKLDADEPGSPPRLLFSLNGKSRIDTPGEFITQLGPATGADWKEESLTHHARLLQSGDWVYLRSAGVAERGEYAFVDRFNLTNHRKQRLFQSAPGMYEEVLSLLDAHGKRRLSMFEARTIPPNLHIVGAGRTLTLTHAVDRAPEVTQARQEKLRYKRADGVELTGVLHLPQSWRVPQTLPVIIWAYPVRYRGAKDSENRQRASNRFAGGRFALSPVPLVTQGYAVFEAGMPVIGGGDVNDTNNDQLAANARAAVEELVRLGVADRERIAISGHSYGGFMVASLLANTDLFAAGVAFSGLYNLTLNPFGFQDEQRSYWQAKETYDRMSPFANADRIRAPLLLIHGEQDESAGAKPIHSKLLFDALNGLGAKSRLVVLPYELHTPSARESILHAHWEMLSWLDRHLKESPAPRGSAWASDAAAIQ